VCVSITGLAGSNIPNANDGSYNSCIIVNYKNKEYVYEIYKNEKGSRNVVRNKQANYIFYRIIQILNEIC
jgi:nicotinamide mononucleotide (NMN) deamidase PncC